MTDFDADFDFSWDSEGSGDAMQTVWIRLLDGLGGIVAVAGARDAWRLSPGTKDAAIGSTAIPVGDPAPTSTTGGSVSGK